MSIQGPNPNSFYKIQTLIKSPIEFMS
jgi:hypothetical protein